MSWTQSKVFRQFLADVLGNTTQMDLDSDTLKAALYGDSITPDQNVAAAASAYGGGVWSTTGGPTGTPQLYETGQWAQGGQALTTVTLNVGTAGVVFLSAANTVSGSGADMSNVVGALIYDDTITTPVAKQGVCFNWFGGANTVVNGTFTVAYSAQGVLRATL